jgi:murein DD-endopeptidase MepM/ murein hydrolase activator NlpD
MKYVIIMLATALTCSTDSWSCESGRTLQHPSPGEIFRRFGYAKHPLLKTLRLHAGWDYQGKEGDPVFAAESGTVAMAGVQGGYGNYVRIDHGKDLETVYAHLQNIDVKPGKCVSKGQVVGTVGSTGLVTRPHLHFEILQDRQFTDPSKLLSDRS